MRKWSPVVLLLVVACAAQDGLDDRDASGVGATGGSAVGGSGGAGALSGSGSGGTSGVDGGFLPFAGEVSATRTTICAGDCVDLRSDASGGVSPYEHTWDQGIGVGAGPHRVCPSSTTIYAVTIRDSSIAFETTEHNPDVHASLTIEVSSEPSCADGGVPASREVCSVRHRVVGGSLPAAGEHLALDSAGRAILGVSTRGALTLGTTEINSPIDDVGVVAAIDDSCTVRWARVFGGAAESGVRIQSVAIDDSDNILVAGSAYGAVDLGLGTFPASGQNAFVTKLHPDGTSIWVRTYASTLFQAEVTGMTIAPGTGEITLIGNAGFDTNFGGGPIGLLTATHLPYLARLTSAGAHVWSKSFQSEELRYAVEAERDASGDVYVSGWSPGTVSFGGAALQAGVGTPYLARLEQSGVQRALRALPGSTNSPNIWNWWNGDVVAIGDREVLVSRDSPESQPDGAVLLNDTLGRYRSDGTTVWERPLSNGSTFTGTSHTHVFDHDTRTLFRVGLIQSPVSFVGGLATAPIGESGVTLVAIDTEGAVQWLHMIDDDLWDAAIGVAARANKVAVLTQSGTTTPDEQSFTLTLLQQ